MPNRKIELDSDEEVIQDMFLDSLDTRSKETKRIMGSWFRNFVEEVGLGTEYEQKDIDRWLKKHGNKTNNCRYFLIKFASFLGVKSGPLITRKIKKIESPKNTKYPDNGERQEIIDATQYLQSSNTTPGEFKLYLKFLNETGVRKAEPLTVTFNDCVYENKIAKVLIRGKGNKQRWVALSFDFYKELLDYCMVHNMSGETFIFGTLKYDKIADIYRQVCRLANRVDSMKRNVDYEENTRFAIKTFTKELIECNKPNGDIYYRKKSYYKPTFPLHRFRKASAVGWKILGLSTVDISYRLGHASMDTTKIYVDEGEEKGLKTWADEHANNPMDAIEIEAYEEKRKSIKFIK